jgi:hypothetical protein
MRALMFIWVVVCAAVCAFKSAAATDEWTAQQFYTHFPVFTLDVHACYPEAPKGLKLSVDLNLTSVRVKDWTEAQPYQFIVDAHQSRSDMAGESEFQVGPFDSPPYNYITIATQTEDGNVYGVAVRVTIPKDGLLATFEAGVIKEGEEDKDACFSKTVLHYSFACRRLSRHVCEDSPHCGMYEAYCLQKKEAEYWNDPYHNSVLTATDTHTHTQRLLALPTPNPLRRTRTCCSWMRKCSTWSAWCRRSRATKSTSVLWM